MLTLYTSEFIDTIGITAEMSDLSNHPSYHKLSSNLESIHVSTSPKEIVVDSFQTMSPSSDDVTNSVVRKIAFLLSVDFLATAGGRVGSTCGTSLIERLL